MVIQELTAGILNGAAAAPTSSLPVKAAAVPAASPGVTDANADADADADDEISQMRARLQQL